jgi:hypothetical protein
MDKVLYFLSALLVIGSAVAGKFNVDLVRSTPDVTFAVAANLMIFPGNLLLQGIIFFTLGLIVGKLNRMLRRPQLPDFGAGDDYRSLR